MKYNEDVLILATKGDKEAFSELYTMIYKDMFRFALFLLGNREDAEDVVSEAVYEIYKGIVKLKDIKAFHRWVFVIISNKSKKVYKKRKEATIDIFDVINCIYDEDDLESEVIIDIQNAFLSLSLLEKNIISYSVIAGYKSEEIGEILKLNPNTVRSKRKRALSKMKKRMEAI